MAKSAVIKPSQQDTGYLKAGPIDIVRHRAVYLGITLALVIPALVFMVLMVLKTPNHAPLRLGIDFTGGTILQYGFAKTLTQSDLPAVSSMLEARGYPGSVIQIQQPKGLLKQDAAPAATTTPVAASAGELSASQIQTILSIRTKPLAPEAQPKLEQAIRAKFGAITLLQKNAIGPALASELLTNGVLALVLAYLLIVGYLTFRFQFDYAVCAIVALVHDTLFVIGVFAALGYFYHVEVDSLFITAILTVVGFSVHDTIVVFDRLRENSRLLFSKKLPFSHIANLSLNQTLARSINTSLTALLTLFALYFLGGDTTRHFVLALILGIATGTFSSIFVASTLLVWWRERSEPQRLSPQAA